MDALTRLALAARDGDEAALAAFVRRSTPDVWRLCRHLGDSSCADDLTQDVYLRALKALPRFRADSSARTWLLAIARNVAADAVRSAARRRRRDRAASLPGPSPDPAAGGAVADLVARLDPDRRTAFVLTQLLGLSYAEVAEVCSVPVGTVRSRVARARSDLVDRLDDAAAQ